VGTTPPAFFVSRGRVEQLRPSFFGLLVSVFASLACINSAGYGV
jgi:hypothetical protein